MTEREKMSAELVTYCGLYCDACAMKNGQIRGTAKILGQMLQAYSYADWTPAVAEFVPAVKHYPEFEGVLEWLTTQDCGGCHAGGGDPACAIRACAQERGFAGCWECPDDGCEKLEFIDQGSPEIAKGRQRIREIGMEAWAAEQASMVEAGFAYFDAGVGTS